MRAPFIIVPIFLAACGGTSPPPSDVTAPIAETSAKPRPSASAAPSAPKSEPTPATIELSPAQKADVKNANAFSLHAFERFKKAASGNVMLSGTSLRQTLATAFLGAEGATAKEMAQVLALPEDREKAAELANAVARAWEEARGTNAELLVADRMWVDKTVALDPTYSALAQSIGVAPFSLEVTGKPEEARKTINAWVSEKTKEKIHELLPAGSLDPRTRMLLTNAIYFKGRWATPFLKNATKDEPFVGAKTANVPMMHVIDSFRWAEESSASILEMPYEGSDLALLVVLPTAKDGLAKLEEKLDVDALDRWTSALQTTRVDVALPKFSFRSGGAMGAMLQDMGMKTAFSDRADFDKMAGPKEKLRLGPVFHQTWIALDEVGTEAAAATGVVMRTTSLMVGEPKRFRADHPFLFFVRDAKRGRVLFVGRVVDPKAGA